MRFQKDPVTLEKCVLGYVLGINGANATIDVGGGAEHSRPWKDLVDRLLGPDQHAAAEARVIAEGDARHAIDLSSAAGTTTQTGSLALVAPTPPPSRHRGSQEGVGGNALQPTTLLTADIAAWVKSWIAFVKADARARMRNQPIVDKPDDRLEDFKAPYVASTADLYASVRNALRTYGPHPRLVAAWRRGGWALRALQPWRARRRAEHEGSGAGVHKGYFGG